MKIAIFGKTDIGGIKTHVEYLYEEFSKNNEVRLLSQDDFVNLNILKGLYHIDIKGLEKIKDTLAWCDVFHIHHPSSSFELFLPSMETDKPIINTFHMAIGHQEIIFNTVKLVDYSVKALVDFYARLYSGKSAKYITVGSMLAARIKKFNDTVIINNGVSPEKLRKKKAKRHFDEFTVGYIGRVSSEKNVETLINACIDLGIPIVVCGVGRGFDRMKRLYPFPKVKFLDEIAYPPTDFYNSVDVFCNPSFIEANINLTVLEAMACERPVITCAAGGEEKNIRNEFGILSKPDKESLKKSIRQIMRSDLKAMGRAGRKEIKEKYNIKDMARKIYMVYESARESTSWQKASSQIS
jgi:glycosyltransferase involved in cell wall biosynthesis